MSKKKDDGPIDDWEQRLENASTVEKLQMNREFKAELWEKYGSRGGVTPEEYAKVDDTITYLEIATHFEASLSEQELRDFPSRSQRARLDAWWDWLGGICANRGRIAREMGIDEETIKRWNREMLKYQDNVNRNEKAARIRAAQAVQSLETNKIADFLLDEMDENNAGSMYLPPNDILGKKGN